MCRHDIIESYPPKKKNRKPINLELLAPGMTVEIKTRRKIKDTGRSNWSNYGGSGP